MGDDGCLKAMPKDSGFAIQLKNTNLTINDSESDSHGISRDKASTN